jgi:hypothetical protein
LTLDVEKELAELFLQEVECHRGTERLKQELEASKGYQREQSYYSLDDCNLKFIYAKNIERFLFSQGLIITQKELNCIIRRTDLDSDGKISKEEFFEAIQPQEPFSKMLVRTRVESQKKKNEQAKSQRNLLKTVKPKTLNTQALD